MSRQFSAVNRRRFLQSTALGAAALVHTPAVLRAQGAPVKVGVLHPVSGALSYSGQQGRIGAQLAIEEINAAGGIKGQKVELLVKDDECKPPLALNWAKQFVERDKVVAYFPSTNTTPNLTSLQVTVPVGVPHRQLPGPGPGPGRVRVQLRPAGDGEAFVRRIFEMDVNRLGFPRPPRLPQRRDDERRCMHRRIGLGAPG